MRHNADYMKPIADTEYQCKYCGVKFSRESTLNVHQCEPKRRELQKNEKGVTIGFNAWLRFYELTQGSAKLKTYEEFCQSSLYGAFVKFGRHCVAISAINVDQFTDYVLKNNFKIDHWCRDAIYSEYLFHLLRHESATDALERSIVTMQKWSEEFPQYQFNEYFTHISPNRLIQHIQNGRISPWVIYCCDNGTEKLSQLTEDQLEIIIAFIDPPFWERHLRDYPADTEMTRHILSEAGC